MPVPDPVVARALAAYESLPPLAGRFERMRAAIEAVAKRRPEPEDDPAT
jgi:hypothetical protein